MAHLIERGYPESIEPHFDWESEYEGQYQDPSRRYAPITKVTLEDGR